MAERQETLLYKFSEGSLTVIGEKETLLDLVRYLSEVDVDSTWGDLIYKIEREFNEGFRLETDE